MTKTEAAAYLGVSIRTLQRLMTAGKVGFKSTKNRAGVKVMVFDRAELDRYRDERVKEIISPSVSESDTAPASASSPVSEALQVRGLTGASLPALIEALRPQPPPPVAIVDKLALSVGEAEALTGYSQDFIRAAIKAGKLKGARGRRRGYDIKRADLEAWVKKL